MSSLTLISLLTSTLNLQRSTPRHPKDFGWFIEMIPMRLGRNEAFDHAAACFMMAYHDVLRGASGLSEKSHEKYLKAIQSLQKCLGDQTKCFAAETLGAVMLLAKCEVIIMTDE